MADLAKYTVDELTQARDHLQRAAASAEGEAMKHPSLGWDVVYGMLEGDIEHLSAEINRRS